MPMYKAQPSGGHPPQFLATACGGVKFRSTLTLLLKTKIKMDPPPKTAEDDGLGFGCALYIGLKLNYALSFREALMRFFASSIRNSTKSGVTCKMLR